MKRRMIIAEWGKRFLHQVAVIATGIFGLVLLAALDIGNVLSPDWLAYAILAIVALTAGSYLVFEDLWKEYQQEKAKYESTIAAQEVRARELEGRIGELEARQPRISAGFQDDAGRLVKRIKFQLRPLPQSPDLDSLVEEKRKHLLRRKADEGSPLALVKRPNPDYLEELEQYLAEYRQFLYRQYEYSFALDRTRCIVPAVENGGNGPATALKVELSMPKAYQAPAKHQFHPRLPRLEEIDGYSVESLQESKEFCEAILLDPPQEPQPVVEFGVILGSVFYADSFVRSPVPSVISSTRESDNTEGPIEETRDGVELIVYRVERLVQGCREDEFEPLWMWLGEIKHPMIWEIPVRITCAELPQPQEDMLVLDILVAEGSGS
jgi:hypothetical protein